MTLIDRSVLTDLFLDRLEPEPGETRSWVVGDHEKPRTGGWQGEPGVSDWVPYIILTAGPSQTPTGSLASPNADVWFAYSVTSVGAERRQVERTAAMARERMFSTKRTQTSDGRSISAVQVTRYGGNERLNVSPPLYLVTDQFSVFTTP